MGLAGRDLISINDFTNEEIEAVLDLAGQMNSALEKGTQIKICNGKDMATLFYEASTRTRGSFERAMHKLGGTVVSFAEAQTSSSAAKGETIADTVRVLESYADIIVIRHPLEGAAKVAADYAQVPVINAGDGAHEHPTQTLCDLYTIKEEKGRIKGLTVCLMGDLKYGRTVHSLIYALARFGAEVFCWPPVPDLDMPAAVVNELCSKYNYVPKKVKPDNLKDIMGEADVLYMAPVKPFTYPLPWADLEIASSVEMTIREALGKADVVYVTRLQTERRIKPGDSEWEESQPMMSRELLEEFRKKPLVMHPLPRVNELPSELDKYERSVYFRQAAYGVPIRMALTALLVGASEIKVPQKDNFFLRETPYERYKEVVGVVCPNPKCITRHEREGHYALPKFKMIKGKSLTLRCVYCDHETHPPYIASSEKGRKYHSSNSVLLDQIKREHLIIFGSEAEAQAQGFRPSEYAVSG